MSRTVQRIACRVLFALALVIWPAHVFALHITLMTTSLATADYPSIGSTQTRSWWRATARSGPTR